MSDRTGFAWKKLIVACSDKEARAPPQMEISFFKEVYREDIDLLIKGAYGALGTLGRGKI